MKDLLGQEIKVGSILFHTSSSNERSVVKVIAFAKKVHSSWYGPLEAVVVEHLADFRYGYQYKTKKNSSITSEHTLLVIDEVPAVKTLKKE